MGQKVNPKSFRLASDFAWNSKWFAQKKYQGYLAEDLEIKKSIMAKLPPVTVEKIEIERKLGEINITIYTSRPGVVIGRSGQGTAELKEFLSKKIKGKLNINIAEVSKPDLSASIIAQNIAYQIEKRIAFKRAAKVALQKAQESGVLGIKIKIAGRLNGAEIARSEKFNYGSIPLQTIRANIDYARVNAYTTYGVIGVKVWVYKGEVFDKKSAGQAANQPESKV